MAAELDVLTEVVVPPFDFILSRIQIFVAFGDRSTPRTTLCYFENWQNTLLIGLDLPLMKFLHVYGLFR